MTEQRFLVVRLSSLGDIVHTFPAVAGLRESFPKAEIVWLTHPRWELLVESSSLATEIWATETRSVASLHEILSRIRGHAFDAAIDYQGLWKSAAFSFLGGIPRRIGFSSETIREYGVPILYTDRVRSTQAHIADQNGELSQRAGAHQATGNVNLSVSQAEESEFRERLRGLGVDRYVALSPGGGWRSKCWPSERFGSLCKKIRDSLGLRCIVTTAPEKNLWPPPCGTRAAMPLRFSTMVSLDSSCPSCATPSALSAVTPAHSTSQYLSELLQSRCSVPPIPRAMARIEAAAAQTPFRSTSSCVALVPSPLTNAAHKLTLRCWKLKSNLFSNGSAVSSRRAHERPGSLFRPLAGSPRLSAGDCRSVVCPSHAPQPSLWRAGW